MYNYVKTLSIPLAFVFLLACGGGGGGGRETVQGTNNAIPGVPANIGVTYGAKSYTFKWDEDSSVTHYELSEYATELGTDSRVVIHGQIIKATHTYYLNSLLHEQLNKSYNIRGCSAAGCSGYSSDIKPEAIKAIGYFKASNSDPGDHFGHAVSLSRDGNTLAVSAPGESSSSTGVNGVQADNNTAGSGAVYVYVRDAGKWRQQAYLKAPVSRQNTRFGSLAVSSNGNVLAVGAGPGETYGQVGGQGAVYIFERIGEEWTLTDSVAPRSEHNPDIRSSFGGRVAIAGDGKTLAVSASSDSTDAKGINGTITNAINYASGALYIFDRRGGGRWIEQAYIKTSNPLPQLNFGILVSLSLDGNVLGTSSWREGAAYIFTRSGQTWTQQARLQSPNLTPLDSFGWSIAISESGTSLAVSAPREASSAVGINGDLFNSLAPDSGAVYLFANNNGRWMFDTYIKASSPSVGFGSSLAFSSDAKSLKVGSYNMNSIFSFEKTSRWAQTKPVLRGRRQIGNYIGDNISLSGDGTTLAAGDYGESGSYSGIKALEIEENINSNMSGAVFLY